MTEVTISGLCNNSDLFHAVPVVETLEHDGAKRHSMNHVAMCGVRVDQRRPYKTFASLIRKSRCPTCDGMVQQAAVDEACKPKDGRR